MVIIARGAPTPTAPTSTAEESQRLLRRARRFGANRGWDSRLVSDIVGHEPLLSWLPGKIQAAVMFRGYSYLAQLNSS